MTHIIRFATGQLAWNALPPYGEGGGNAGGENPVISVIEFYVSRSIGSGGLMTARFPRGA